MSPMGGATTLVHNRGVGFYYGLAHLAVNGLGVLSGALLMALDLWFWNLFSQNSLIMLCVSVVPLGFGFEISHLQFLFFLCFYFYDSILMCQSHGNLSSIALVDWVGGMIVSLFLTAF